VLPILHVNGFKISERTIFGCMDDKELIALFSGYGYQVCIVDDLADMDAEFSAALEWALNEIKVIQYAARTERPLTKPRWPMIILKTPKVRHQPSLPGLHARELSKRRAGPDPKKWMA
jgi:xylulose-5-phosphate/fructose-6-phosphate phosphoketolase